MNFTRPPRLTQADDGEQGFGISDLGLQSSIGSKIQGSDVQGSTQPLTVKAAGLIEEETYIAHDIAVKWIRLKAGSMKPDSPEPLNL